MDVLLTLIAFVWIIRIALNTLSYTHMWWVKEYRWDRMIIHLRTPQGRRFWWPSRRRPPISPKSTLLVLLSLSILGSIVWALNLPIILRLAIADMLSFPVTWLLVLMLNAPTKVYHAVLVALAVRKLRLHKPMTVIGITGSYGKTSVKDYLATILSIKFITLKTEASKNSAIGIAEAILQRLNPQHEVFVVEMGAYRIGEIANMVRMVKPEVGIIIAVNEQHQDLFGSIDNTIRAKYELIEGLVGKQIAIFNIDNPYVAEMAAWAVRDGTTVWGMTQTKIIPKITLNTLFRITTIVQDRQNLSFTISTGKKSAVVRAQIIGVHQVVNITAAVAGAVACGMSLSDAVQAASLIEPIDGMMKPIKGINRSTFIDDTFNNNPDAAIAAIEYLRVTKGKKILVFQPMIELGAFAQQAHERVGEYAARVCDEVILTNGNYRDDFVKGMRNVSEKDAQVLSSAKAGDFIRRAITIGDTVLFKGKEAINVLNQLKNG